MNAPAPDPGCSTNTTRVVRSLTLGAIGTTLAGCVLLNPLDHLRSGITEAVDETAPDSGPHAELQADGDAPPTPRDLVVGRGTPSRLVVDDAHVFWLEQGSTLVERRLMRADKHGHGVVALAGDLYDPRGLAASTEAIYIVDNGPFGGSTTVQRQPKAGGLVSTIELTKSGRIDTFAHQGDRLFYALVEPSGAHSRTWIETLDSRPPLSLEARTTFASDVGDLTAIAVDATHAYAARTTDVVAFDRAAPTAMRTARVLASTTSAAVVIVLDDEAVYWAEPTSVRRVPKGGGPVVDLATGQSDVGALALDETYAYWVDTAGGAVRRAPKRGGPVEDVSTGEAGPSSVAVDATGVYWTNHDDGRIRHAARR